MDPSALFSLKMLDQNLSEQGFPAAYASAFFAMVIFKQTVEYTAIQSLFLICIKWVPADPSTMFLETSFIQKCHNAQIQCMPPF